MNLLFSARFASSFKKSYSLLRDGSRIRRFTSLTKLHRKPLISVDSTLHRQLWSSHNCIEDSTVSMSDDIPSTTTDIISAESTVLYKQLIECGVYGKDVFVGEVVQRTSIADSIKRPCFEISIDASEVSVNDLGQRYHTGDHVAVFPKNCVTDVDVLISAMGWDESTLISVSNINASSTSISKISLKNCLIHCIEISKSLNDTLKALLLLNTKRANDTIAIEKILSSCDHDYVNIMDIICQCPWLYGRIDPTDYILAATGMCPRIYSLASSSLLHPNEAKICYRIVQYITSTGKTKEGLCSAFFGGLTPGDFVPIQLKSSHMRLPSNCALPVILIGAGTGIAPYRGFIEDKCLIAQNNSIGDVLMYLGFRDETEVMYKDVWSKALIMRVISSLDIAYSSDTIQLEVADHIRNDASRVWSAIQNGAVVYLCGAADLRESVASALEDIAITEGLMDRNSARTLFNNMRESRRYIEDAS